MKQQYCEFDLEVMKVMNYTDFMNKLSYHLFPKSLEQIYPELEALGRVGRLRRDLDLIANADPLGIMKRELTSETLSECADWATRPFLDAELSKMVEVAGPADWSAIVRYCTRPGLKLHGYAPAMFFGGGDAVLLPDVKINVEKVEVAELRQEVEELKQQVAVLTGLVNLRVEPVSDPLAAAKSRGASYMKNELANPDNLSLVDASKYAGRSDRLINVERNKGWLYALVPEGNTRGYRYPKWQFDVPAPRLRAILDTLAPGSLSCWALHNFLTRSHSDLDGKSPAAALADGDFPIDQIIDVARRRIDQHQGTA